jgi:hypothetical protein
MRVGKSHIEAICFILLILDSGKQSLIALTRSRIVLQYAVGRACLTWENCISFWRNFPKELDEVRDFLDTLRKVKTAKFFEVQELARQYSMLKSFPSIKVTIGEHLVKMNEERGDLLAAFVTQWKVASLIADVLKLRGVSDQGIPEGKQFPLISNEIEIAISTDPNDSAYLALESELLTMNALKRAVHHGLELAQRVMLPQIHCTVCMFMLYHLGLAMEVDDSNGKIDWLGTTNNKTVRFVRVFLQGQIAKQHKLTDLIVAFPCQKVDINERVRSFCTEFFGGSEFLINESHEGIPTSGTANRCSFTNVKCSGEERDAFAVRKFWVDVRCPVPKKWDETIIKRYTFETNQALPSITSIAVINKSGETKVAKVAYFEAKLGTFEKKLTAEYKNMKAIIPPNVDVKKWSVSVGDISPEPIIRMIEKVRLAIPNPSFPYGFVWNAFDNQAGVDTPTKITEIVVRICKRIRKSVVLCDRLRALRPFEEKEMLTLQRFRTEGRRQRADSDKIFT